MTAIPIASTMLYAKWPREESMVPEESAQAYLIEQLEFIEDEDRTHDELLFHVRCQISVQQDFSRWITSWMPAETPKDASGIDVEKLRATALVLHAMTDALVEHRPIDVERPEIPESL